MDLWLLQSIVGLPDLSAYIFPPPSNAIIPRQHCACRVDKHQRLGVHMYGGVNFYAFWANSQAALVPPLLGHTFKA